MPRKNEKVAEFTAVQDHGGEHVQYGTGATREARTGKGRYDLVPPYPMKRLAQHYENGALKYADRNWEKGLPLGRAINSAIGHLFAFMDNERSEDHLAAALWNICAYIHTERKIAEGSLPAELSDVPWDTSVAFKVEEKD